MAITCEEDLLIRAAREASFIDHFLIARLPTLASLTSNMVLRQAIDRYLDACRDNADRMEDALMAMAGDVGRRRSLAIEAMLDDADTLLMDIENDGVRDTALHDAVAAIGLFEENFYATLGRRAESCGQSSVGRLVAAGRLELEFVIDKLGIVECGAGA